jgi:hypothetical protein
VDATNNRLVLRNVSGSTVDLWTRTSVGRSTGWVPVRDAIAAGRAPVHLTISGTNDASSVCMNSPSHDIDNDDEITVHNPTTAHTPSNLACYIRYGLSAPSLYESSAVSQGMWVLSGTVSMCDGHDAVEAIGDVTAPSGYQSTSSACE